MDDIMLAKKLSIVDAITELSAILDKYDWFYSCDTEYSSIVVYVNLFSQEIMDMIPKVLYGWTVKLHFSDYATCEDKFARKWTLEELKNNSININ